jgi:hypothetical protein
MSVRVSSRHARCFLPSLEDCALPGRRLPLFIATDSSAAIVGIGVR